jgi:hypothetical protein
MATTRITNVFREDLTEPDPDLRVTRVYAEVPVNTVDLVVTRVYLEVVHEAIADFEHPPVIAVQNS